MPFLKFCAVLKGAGCGGFLPSASSWVRLKLPQEEIWLKRPNSCAVKWILDTVMLPLAMSRLSDENTDYPRTKSNGSKYQEREERIPHTFKQGCKQCNRHNATTDKQNSDNDRPKSPKRISYDKSEQPSNETEDER